jgi:hypothetical protein|tara:strand:- start:562 stop:783 length:222 start_codon:yes stop_codon:yes gene_type:complete
MISDKFNEMLIGVVVLLGGFITKRVYSKSDLLDQRISALEKVVVTKEDLRLVIKPIERNVDIILTHILDKKND